MNERLYLDFVMIGTINHCYYIIKYISWYIMQSVSIIILFLLIM